MKKLLLVLLFVPLVSFGQYKTTVTELGVETIKYNKSLTYIYDGNPFNDNEETLTLIIPTAKCNHYVNAVVGCFVKYIKMSKSDISPFKIEFFSHQNIRGEVQNKQKWIYHNTGWVSFYEFIFDNDKTTYMKLNESRAEKIVSLDDEFFIKFKKHKKVFVRYTGVGVENWEDDYVIDLKGMTAGFNKFSGVKTPSMKNKSLYRVANGLANVNPFNLDKYIDKFILDAKKNHNINLSYVNKTERLILFRELEGETIAAAYKQDDDNKLLVLVDPENWYAANQVKRWYIIYHELGHDILNLEHGEGGAMMDERASGKYTWDRLEKDKTIMFETYKSKF